MTMYYPMFTGKFEDTGNIANCPANTYGNLKCVYLKELERVWLKPTKKMPSVRKINKVPFPSFFRLFIFELVAFKISAQLSISIN